MSNAKSILQKLRNKARQADMSFQIGLQLFCQEEFLRRLSYSNYKNNFILKDGLFLYLITGFGSRPTMDIDFLMRNQSNENEKTREMIMAIIDTNTCNEFIRFEIRSVEPISEQRKYHGIRVKMIGFIDNTRTPFNIDIGVGDVVVPKPSEVKLEALLEGFVSPKILVYSLESTIAEKWDAIIDRMELNSRMKDFYDIYYLAVNYNFEGRKLQEAISETLANRGRTFEKDTLEKVRLLGNDRDFIVRWRAFTQNILKIKLDFDSIVDVIIKFIGKPFENILYEKEFFLKWNKTKGQWD